MKKLYLIKAYAVWEYENKKFTMAERDFRVLGEDVEDAIWNLKRHLTAEPSRYMFDEVGEDDAIKAKLEKVGINDCVYTGQFVDITGEYN
jgi:hypothetical protein